MIGQTSPLSQTLQSLQSSRLLWRVVIALLLSFFLLHLALLKSNGVGVHGLSYFKYKSTEWEEDDLLKDVHNSTLGVSESPRAFDFQRLTDDTVREDTGYQSTLENGPSRRTARHWEDGRYRIRVRGRRQWRRDPAEGASTRE